MYGPDFVDWFKGKLEEMKDRWGAQFARGYKARLDGLPRMARRREGAFLKGWDTADNNLKSEKEQNNVEDQR